MKFRVKVGVALLGAASIVFGTAVLLVAPAQAAVTDYYVNAATGSDSNPGTLAAPWQTITKVNSTTLTSGQTVHFEGGQTFTGCLTFGTSESGTATAPITVTNYGTGNATINCTTAGSSGIRILNTGGFSISNLNLTTTAGYKTAWYGLEMHNNLAGGIKKTYFRINNMDISQFIEGIAIYADPTDKNPAAGFSDVRITNVRAHSNEDAGIQAWSNADDSTNPSAYNFDNIYVGSSQAYNNPGEPNKGNNSGSGIVFGNASNVTIEYCTAYGNGTTNNYTGGGPVGIWVYQSTNALIQYNESYNNSRGTDVATDGDGFDLDGGTTNSIVQYNYSHNNDGAGVLAFQYKGGRPWSGNTIRYNISVNDDRKGNYGGITTGSYWSTSPVSNLSIYGNTIYMNKTTYAGSNVGVQSGLRFWDGGSNIKAYNNVVYTTGGAVRLVSEEYANPGIVLDNNDYWSGGATTNQWVWGGGNPWNPDRPKKSGQFTDAGATFYSTFAAYLAGTKQDAHSIWGDPGLTAAGSAPTLSSATTPLTPALLASLSAYTLSTSSTIADSGANLPALGITPGTRDFYGNAIPAGPGFSIGAYDR